MSTASFSPALFALALTAACATGIGLAAGLAHRYRAVEITENIRAAAFGLVAVPGLFLFRCHQVSPPSSSSCPAFQSTAAISAANRNPATKQR